MSLDGIAQIRFTDQYGKPLGVNGFVPGSLYFTHKGERIESHRVEEAHISGDDSDLDTLVLVLTILPVLGVDEQNVSAV